MHDRRTWVERPAKESLNARAHDPAGVRCGNVRLVPGPRDVVAALNIHDLAGVEKQGVASVEKLPGDLAAMEKRKGDYAAAEAKMKFIMIEPERLLTDGAAE